jgi:hypothetical protein
MITQTSLSFLDTFTVEIVSNLRECLTYRSSDSSISCDAQILSFLESSSSALNEVFQMIDTEKRETFPLIIYPGVQSGMLKQLESSSQDYDSKSNKARLDIVSRVGSGSWVPYNSDAYLMFSASQPVQFHSIETRGDLTQQQWVQSYRIQYTLDGNSWYMYKKGLIFQGNTENSQGVNNTFDPFVARAVKVLPIGWNSKISLRAEMYISDIYYEAEPPSERLVLINAIQSGFNVISHTFWDEYHQPEEMFLNFRSKSNLSPWCSNHVQSKNDAIIASPVPVRWHRISFQSRGKNIYYGWIISLSISYTVDGINWIDYDNGAEFLACYDMFSINSIEFVPFVALAMKIIPKTFKNNMCLRLEAYCSRV